MPGTATRSCCRKKRGEERLPRTGLSLSGTLSTAAPHRPPAGPQGSRGGSHVAVPGDSQALGKMQHRAEGLGGQELPEV